MSIERQEIHCHNCNQYVQFDIDTELDGRHVLKCPQCGHEHCRIVNKGVISDERWDQRNGPNTMQTYQAYNVTSSSTSVTTMYVTYSGSTSSGTSLMSDLWLQTQTLP